MYLFDSRSVQPIPAPFMRQSVAGTTEPTPTKQPQPVAAELIPKKSDNEDLAPVEKVQPQVEENKLIGEDRLKAGEISISEFIPLNGLNFDDYDFWRVGDTTQKTQYQTLMNEMLGVAEEHIALARKKFISIPQERRARDKALNLWGNAIDAILTIQRKYENPFTTALAVRRDIPKLLKQRFEKKFAYRDWETDRKSTRLNSSHSAKSRMPSSA